MHSIRQTFCLDYSAAFKLFCPSFWCCLLCRREVCKSHNTHDSHSSVQDGQIVEMMITHNFPCFIQRLILEAEVRFFYHDFANNCRLRIMAKAW